MRKTSVLRAAAWGVVAAGVAAPLLRRRVPGPPIVPQATAYAAPLALCVAARRTRRRDVAVCALQMWAYIAAYKAPHDDERSQTERVHLDYPIVCDRVLGLGQLPTLRLQRALAHRDRWTNVDRALVWTHWIWFLVPHTSLAYVLIRRPRRFERAAVMTYAVFNLGAIVYWLVPTAPPWYAAQRHEDVPDELLVRRMMVEYGEFFWRDGWGPLYSVLGGNPLAAMPSLHFATSVMAASLLAEVGPLPGAVGWTYALLLGYALVYLGEHYVIDLVAGAALTAGVRRLGPRAAPALRRVASGVAALNARALGEA